MMRVRIERLAHQEVRQRIQRAVIESESRRQADGETRLQPGPELHRGQ